MCDRIISDGRVPATNTLLKIPSTLSPMNADEDKEDANRKQLLF